VVTRRIVRPVSVLVMGVMHMRMGVLHGFMLMLVLMVFLHYWGKGKAQDLARSLKRVLDAQASVKF
jgi:hypothetical protein